MKWVISRTQTNGSFNKKSVNDLFKMTPAKGWPQSVTSSLSSFPLAASLAVNLLSLSQVPMAFLLGVLWRVGISIWYRDAEGNFPTWQRCEIRRKCFSCTATRGITSWLLLFPVPLCCYLQSFSNSIIPFAWKGFSSCHKPQKSYCFSSEVDMCDSLCTNLISVGCEFLEGLNTNVDYWL